MNQYSYNHQKIDKDKANSISFGKSVTIEIPKSGDIHPPKVGPVFLSSIKVKPPPVNKYIPPKEKDLFQVNMIKPLKLNKHKHDICGVGLAEEDDIIEHISEELEEYPDTSESSHEPESGKVNMVELTECDDNIMLKDGNLEEVEELCEDELEPMPSFVVEQSKLEEIMGKIHNNINLNKKKVESPEPIKIMAKKPVAKKIVIGEMEKHNNVNPLDHGIEKQKFSKKQFVFNQKFLSLITPERFNQTNFVLQSHILPKNPNLLMFSSYYLYSPENQNRLIIQTDFMDLYYTDPIKKKNECLITYNGLNKLFGDNENKGFNIKINHKLFPESMMNFMKFYDGEINKDIQGKVPNHINNNLLANINSQLTDEFNELQMAKGIKGKISKDYDFKNYNKIINYNISKKYPRKEEFKIDTLSTKDIEDLFSRTFNNRKQIRFLFTPVSWLQNGSNFGSYLKIIAMEIKYKDAKIYSPLDQDETSVMNDIGTITI